MTNLKNLYETRVLEIFNSDFLAFLNFARFEIFKKVLDDSDDTNKSYRKNTCVQKDYF